MRYKRNANHAAILHPLLAWPKPSKAAAKTPTLAALREGVKSNARQAETAMPRINASRCTARNHSAVGIARGLWDLLFYHAFSRCASAGPVSLRGQPVSPLIVSACCIAAAVAAADAVAAAIDAQPGSRVELGRTMPSQAMPSDGVDG